MQTTSNKILLVEDNPSDARMVAEYLDEVSLNSYQLTHVDRLSKAFQYLASAPCDVTLLDLHLPDSEGLQTLRAFREQAPNVPVVVFTGLDDGFSLFPIERQMAKGQKAIKSSYALCHLPFVRLIENGMVVLDLTPGCLLASLQRLGEPSYEC